LFDVFFAAPPSVSERIAVCGLGDPLMISVPGMMSTLLFGIFTIFVKSHGREPVGTLLVA
jgi:hypothetical protein